MTCFSFAVVDFFSIFRERQGRQIRRRPGGRKGTRRAQKKTKMEEKLSHSRPNSRRNFFFFRQLFRTKSTRCGKISLANSLTRTHAPKTAHKMLSPVLFTANTFSIVRLVENSANPLRNKKKAATLSGPKINTRRQKFGDFSSIFKLFFTLQKEH